MTISVVIPAYNEEKYLPKTLASLKKLLRQPDEIVVVNASSTDKTATVAKQFGARVITTPLKTIGYSRQKGLTAARCDVIAFTDSDAILPPDWLTVIENELQRPGVVGFFGGFRIPDGPWWYRLYVNFVQPILNVLYYHIFGLAMATGQNMAFYKKTAVKVGGFPEEFKMAEDLEIAKRLQGAGKIIFKQGFFVVASGRRGNEGFIELVTRISKVFFYYILFHRADKIGFPS
ncbi:glycosyltransferase, partial [Candidatus Gottesmanbacteria bacterium]|nr:glycosyltransferase [Candidatus Gottesmanbacteria bacterium]